MGGGAFTGLLLSLARQWGLLTQGEPPPQREHGAGLVHFQGGGGESFFVRLGL